MAFAHHGRNQTDDDEMDLRISRELERENDGYIFPRRQDPLFIVVFYGALYMPKGDGD